MPITRKIDLSVCIMLSLWVQTNCAAGTSKQLLRLNDAVRQTASLANNEEADVPIDEVWEQLGLTLEEWRDATRAAELHDEIRMALANNEVGNRATADQSVDEVWTRLGLSYEEYMEATLAADLHDSERHEDVFGNSGIDRDGVARASEHTDEDSTDSRLTYEESRGDATGDAEMQAGEGSDAVPSHAGVAHDGGSKTDERELSTAVGLIKEEDRDAPLDAERNAARRPDGMSANNDVVGATTTHDSIGEVWEQLGLTLQEWRSATLAAELHEGRRREARENVPDKLVLSPSDVESAAMDRVQRNMGFLADDTNHNSSACLSISRYSREGWVTAVANFLTNENSAIQTASQELWMTLGGEQMIDGLHEYRSYHYEVLVGVMLLASELALKPTKIGMTQFNIDDPKLQALCKNMENEIFLKDLQTNMNRRMHERSFRSGMRYTYEYVPIYYGESALLRHPLANVPVICSVENFEIKRAILNHRIGRHMSATVLNEYPQFQLRYASTQFDVFFALLHILDATPEALLYGVTLVTYDNNNEGVMGPGVIRDWFGKIVQRIFDPKNGFFVLPEGESDDLSYRINIAERGMYEESLMESYRAIGRVFAMSLIDDNPIGVKMNYGLYLILMGRTDEWTERDLLKDDKALHKSWSDIVHADDVSAFGLSMRSLDQQRPLVSGDVDLTNENVVKWSKLAIADHMYGKAKKYYTALVQGFYDLLPKNIFEGLLNPEDLRDMLRGNINISAKDLIAAMEYRGAYSMESDQIRWLHEIITRGTAEFRLQFLTFITGLEALPFEFGKSADRKLIINSVDGDNTRLPKAHTCFYIIDIPLYPSKEVMRRKLHQAVVSTDMSGVG